MGESVQEPPATARRRALVYGCLFVTGAVTIALELIAARLLTPYVGGSLYVWTAILTITLLALAAGYHFGSRWSHRPGVSRLFARFPALTALALCVAVPLYPLILPTVAFADALVGAFVGCLLVLGPALLLLSALNPLAVALTARGDGDRGAGEAFAVSTVGSVAGALAGAFLLLPYMAPATALVTLAAALLVVAAAVLPLARDRMTAVGLVPAGVAAVVVAGITLLAPPDRVDLGDLRLEHVETVRNAHATVVVVDAEHAERPGTVRLYLEENQMQSARSPDLPGEPLFYIALAEAALEAMMPERGRVLVLGLAGGTIAQGLADAGYDVAAVDINPAASRIAERWFGFDPAAVPVTVADARRHLDHCTGRWDAIFFDVFSGLTAPDHLVTREAFAAAGRCLAPGGVVVANTIVPPLDARPTRRLMAAMARGVAAGAGAARPARLSVYQGTGSEAWRHNRVMVARPDGRPAPVLEEPQFPTDLFGREARRIEPILVDPAWLADAPPLTDARNDFALAVARMAEGLAFLPIPMSWL